MDLRRLSARCSIGIWLSISLPASSAAAVVLVPADPAPAPGALCASGARDVIASVQDSHRTTSPWRQPFGVLALRTATGGRQRVGLAAGCPSAAAGADGTAIVGFSVLRSRRVHPRLIVRRPGAGFSAPLVPGAGFSARLASVPHVAAAHGGWVAAAWAEFVEVDRTGQSRVAVAVVAPDGSLRTATFDVSSRDQYGQGVQISPPVVGIDAAGVATVVWTRYRVATDRYTVHVSEQAVRMARTTPGATAWLPAENLAAGGDDPLAEQADEEPTNPRVGIAVAAGGRVAIAWTTPTQVWVAEGQGSERPLPAPVADIPAAGSPAVALGNGGAAVVSFLASTGPPDERKARVLAIDRASPGTWSAPHSLWAAPARSVRYEGDPESPLAVALAEDGRAVVTWTASSLESQAMAATGRAGGAWTSARFVSAATRRLAFPPAAMIDAADHPVALWTELAPEARGRLQADRAINDDDAAPPDRVPPAVAFTTPGRMPLTRSGLVRSRALVTCSEACDVRFRVLVTPDGELQAAVRSLPAGRRTPITLPLDKRVSEILRNPYSGGPDRLEVLVTDRAGNVTRRSRHVTVKRGRSPKLDV